MVPCQPAGVSPSPCIKMIAERAIELFRPVDAAKPVNFLFFKRFDGVLLGYIVAAYPTLAATGLYSERKSLFPKRYLRQRKNQEVTNSPSSRHKADPKPNPRARPQACRKELWRFCPLAPHGTGKTTSLRAFATQLQAEGRDVIFTPMFLEQWGQNGFVRSTLPSVKKA